MMKANRSFLPNLRGNCLSIIFWVNKKKYVFVILSNPFLKMLGSAYILETSINNTDQHGSN